MDSAHYVKLKGEVSLTVSSAFGKVFQKPEDLLCFAVFR